MRAQLAAEPLGRDQDDGGRHVERRDAHVEQAQQRRRRVVRVQRREHEVARLRRLDRDVRGLEVADFADHDDVRILPQERAQGRGEGEPRLLVHVDLVDAGQLDFRRVFGGRDVDAGLVQDVEARVERHGLAAARRAGHEDHPVRAPDRLQQRLLLVGLVAQRLDAELDARRVEDTHDDLLAEERRQRAHAEVDRLGLRQHDLHPAVLRHALLRDVELGDHLDPRGELVLDHERRLRDLHQDAVEAVADAVELLVRLEMDVRDAGVDRVQQDLLQVPDDRRVLDLRAFLVGDLRRCRLPGGRPPGPPCCPCPSAGRPRPRPACGWRRRACRSRRRPAR